MNKDCRFRWANVTLHDAVRATAEDEGRSMSNMINRLLQEALTAREILEHEHRAAHIKHEGTVT